MEAFGWYILFAVTTGFVSIYELLHPVVVGRVAPIENRFLVYVTFFLICVLVAPVVFLSCIVPSMGERFRNTVEVALFEEQKI